MECNILRNTIYLFKSPNTCVHI